MRRTFASLNQPEKYGYAYDSDVFDYRAQVCGTFRMFETYGDGLCQHSGDWSITRDFMADYLASATAALLAGCGDKDADDNLTQRIASDLQSGANSHEGIAFCASVIFKESDKSWDKRRYYSVSQRKLSASRSKEHDKRYVEIQEWNDGSPAAIYRMLCQDFYHDLQRYTCADSIRQYYLSDAEYQKRGHYMGLTAEFLEWFKDETSHRDKAQDLRRAYETCQAFCESYRLRCAAESTLESIRRGIERAKTSEVSA